MPTTDTSRTATTSGARDHARAQAGMVVDAMPTLPASTATAPHGVDPDDLIWAETVAGGGYAHKVLARGTHLLLDDRDGDACANVVLFSALDPWERLNVADTVKVQWQAYLGAGAALLSDQGRVLATIVRDTSGTHDALCGSSTRLGNEERYGSGAPERGSPSARDLFTLALAKHGLTPRDLPPSVAFFKGARVGADGSLSYLPGSGPGAQVVLRLELPAVVAIANVPHVLDPRTDYVATPLSLRAWRGGPTLPADAQWTASPELERAYLNTADHLEARGVA